MSNITRAIIILPILIGLAACETLSPRACTHQFVAVSVEVTGQNLDQTYTIDVRSGDTVYQASASMIEESYVVLDDSYQEDLQGKERDFRFVGLANDSVLVDEEFEIGADQCHVYKVDGPAQIDL